MQTTSQLLMIRPVGFAFNEQTAVNNAFQVKGQDTNIQDRALKEFDDFVEKLRAEGVEVLVVDDSPTPPTPDAIFPNNWISFHENGSIVLYPMFAPNRRLERKPAVLDRIHSTFRVRHTIDYTAFEEQGVFLEGTGSMVLDRDQKIAYACISPRTDKVLFLKFCEEMSYHPVYFTATDGSGLPIYHTNVMMCVAEQFVVICLDAVKDGSEREYVTRTIHNSGKELIEISRGQMNRFAGNMLQVHNQAAEKLTVMSTQAYESLNGEQRAKISSFNRIIHSPLNTIEANGGGSARCMMAEIFLHAVDPEGSGKYFSK